jgi:protein SCO1/2
VSRNAIRNGLVIALIVSGGLMVMMAILIFGRPRAAAPVGDLDPTVHRGNEPLPVLYSIGEFSFPDQDGRSVSPEDLRGQVWVASIFFGHCKAICPGVVKQLKKLHDAVTDPRVRIVTFTLDPERDTPEKLKEYAAATGADTSRWRFVRAPDQQTIFNFSRNQLKLMVEATGDPDNINHSGQFLLIDGNNRVRGIYDFNDPDDMTRLQKDAAELASSGGR